MNRLQFYDTRDPEKQRGFREIIVTESAHPYVGHWWPPGHLIGYEHSFVHTVADFVRAIVAGKSVSPTFADGLANQRVLAAIEQSARKRAPVMEGRALSRPCFKREALKLGREVVPPSLKPLWSCFAAVSSRPKIQHQRQTRKWLRSRICASK